MSDTELPTFADLEGEYLRGVMQSNLTDAWMLLFFDDYALKLRANNDPMMYSWYDNWEIFGKIPQHEWPDRGSDYKTIGMEIEEVWTDGYDADQHRIDADMDKWIDAVGEGSWNAKQGQQYTFLELRTPIKTVEFGTVYWDCHYPNSVWEVIE